MSFEIRTNRPYIEIRIFGTFTNEDLAQMALEARRIEAAEPVIRHRITDTREITELACDFRGVAAFARDRRDSVFPNAFKSAIIAPDIAHFGFARMFQTLNDHPMISIAIFPDGEEALEWLAAEGVDLPAKAWTPTPTPW
jgi:hypothetical protein